MQQALRAARLRQPLGNAPAKIAAVRQAARHSFPVGSIEDLLGDIERGYLEETRQ